MAQKRYVLLFCDPGIDDVIALMYTLMHPHLELVGIVTSYGNVTKEQATKNAAYVLHLSNMVHIPIIPAAYTSLSIPYQQPFSDIHGSDGLGSFKLPPHSPGNIHQFDTIRQIVHYYKEELLIVELGRMTALAFALNIYKEEMAQVGGYYIMGGAFLVPGNRTTVAEANVYEDAVAADFVFTQTQSHQVCITPLNTTNQAIIPLSLINKLTNHGQYGFLIKEI
ncbi:nucleoside hydrolase [Shouchella patagoniensis]|uniref:nucleoside hydrolase n=1 Tax=Shouchella patagoniensis TaxID=228576 RepID=UPI0009959BEF|nr:nucleoside hydrolase [Shouchella patagoniensis]